MKRPRPPPIAWESYALAGDVPVPRMQSKGQLGTAKSGVRPPLRPHGRRPLPFARRPPIFPDAKGVGDRSRNGGGQTAVADRLEGPAGVARECGPPWAAFGGPAPLLPPPLAPPCPPPQGPPPLLPPSPKPSCPLPPSLSDLASPSIPWITSTALASERTTREPSLPFPRPDTPRTLPPETWTDPTTTEATDAAYLSPSFLNFSAKGSTARSNHTWSGLGLGSGLEG